VATASLQPPLAVVHLDAFDANAADLVRRAAGTPVRAASTSVRCRALLRRALDLPGLCGVIVDASLRIGPFHLGVRRSPLMQPEQVADLQFVNGDGTGSWHVTGKDATLTELAAGSGLHGPGPFDGYDAFTSRPAATFALPVVRRPGARFATALGGGYIASGPPGRSRLPLPHAPVGLRLLRAEGAGEVQTPLRGRGARHLRVGDRVWLRHAMAGELCERFDVLHLVRGRELVETVQTYRGDGRTFG
jgi:D-serine deaminase-like pyridoxal phosphate-dependent protein